MIKKIISVTLLMSLFCLTLTCNGFAKNKILASEIPKKFTVNNPPAINSNLISFTLIFDQEPVTTVQLRTPRDYFLNYINLYKVCGKKQKQNLDYFAKQSNIIKIKVDCLKTTAYTSKYFY